MKSLWVVIISLFVINVSAQEKAASKNEELKPVLIVIDVQNEYMQYMDEDDTKLGLLMINWAINAFRQRGLPVVRVYHTDLNYGPSEDSEAFRFDSSLAILDSDPMIVKNYPNAFKKTNLKEVIDGLGGNMLFLCGLSSVGCVIATYHGAIDNDYDVMMVKDAIMSHDAEQTEDIENIFNTVNASVLNMIIKYGEK